jgi:hypothetical protein
LPLFNSHDEFVGNKNVKFLQVFRQGLTSGEVGDEALFKIFGSDQKGGTKKMKALPASLVCKMEDVTETFSQMPSRVDPSLTPCLPVGEDKQSVLRELQSIPRQPAPSPHLHYVNNVYVRPVSMNVPKGWTNPIAVKIELLDDDKEGQTGLPVVFGGFKEPQFVASHISPIAYNPGKVVMWYSEVKVAVPLNITRKHHLRFTLLEADPGLIDNGKMAFKVIGQTFLPLMQQGGFIGMKHDLTIYPSLKSG